MKLEQYNYLEKLNDLNNKHEFVKIAKTYNGIGSAWEASKRDDVRVQISNDLSSYQMCLGKAPPFAIYTMQYNSFDGFVFKWYDTSEKKVLKKMKNFKPADKEYFEIRQKFVDAGYEEYVDLFELIFKEFTNSENSQ